MARPAFFALLLAGLALLGGCSSCSTPPPEPPRSDPAASSTPSAAEGPRVQASPSLTTTPEAGLDAGGDEACGGEACAARGLCAFDKATHSCMATPLSCKRSTGCRNSGACSIKKQLDQIPRVVCVGPP